MAITIRRDQFYTFVGPDGWIWSEVFQVKDQVHMVAPTPFRGTMMAQAAIREHNPGAIVDELYEPAEIAQVLHWARTAPLEQLD